MGKFETLTASFKEKEEAEIDAKNLLIEKARNEKQAELAKATSFFTAHIAPAISEIKNDLISKDYTFEEINVAGMLFSKEYKITLVKIPLEMTMEHVKKEIVVSLHSTQLSHKVKKKFSIDIYHDIADENSYKEYIKGLISDAVEAIIANTP